MATLYEDKYITLDDDAVTIRRYHFPIGTSKVVPYSSIRSIRVVEMNFVFERLRLWGGGLRGQWMNWDPSRPGKRHCIILDIGTRIDPGLTPDDHERVHQLLLEKTQHA